MIVQVEVEVLYTQDLRKAGDIANEVVQQCLDLGEIPYNEHWNHYFEGLGTPDSYNGHDIEITGAKVVNYDPNALNKY